MNLLLLAFFWCTLISTAQGLATQPGGPKYEGNRDPDITPPPLRTAIVRADNDYVYDEPYEEMGSKRVRLPDAVRVKICAVTLQQFRSTYYETVLPKKYFDLFGPVFRIRVPGDKQRHLYVYKVYTVMHFFDLVLILHDCGTDKVTPNPPRFSGRWMEGRKNLVLMKPPLVNFDDLNLDGNPEVVFQERLHNGTDANAAVYRFLHIGNALSLSPIFHLETRLTLAYHRYAERDGPFAYLYLIRSIEKVKSNRIVVRVSLSTDPFKKGKEQAGFVALESPKASSPFEVKEKITYVGKYEGFLFYAPWLGG